MATATTTLILGTSNIRGSSSKTRNLPARTSRNARSTLRQNSLVSAPTSAQGAPQPENEPHGFYPAIQHFTDAITALPRDFRRHSSLLKEVDAKAWALEENLQKLIGQCIQERKNYKHNPGAQTVAGSVSSISGDVTAASVTGNVLDTASQYSTTSADNEVMRRRRMYAELRQNLMQMIMPLDEKNHVINNANEELSRHIRRQDEIWPHIADEISEETRLGSLRHWALIDLNPTKKAVATNARGREALNPDNEVAERSERRREAMALAKSKKTAAQLLDSDAEARKPTRKAANKKVLEVEEAAAALPPTMQISNLLPSAKAIVNRGTARRAVDNAMKKFGPGAGVGGASMSRENSQQDNTRKRKAPPAATTARKRYVDLADVTKHANSTIRVNTANQDSPKLAQSPLAGTFSKDVHKKSPALANSRPANGRGRQSSTQQVEPSGRPASTASRRNGVTAAGVEMERVVTATGKTTGEVRHTMRETANSKGDKMLEEDVPDSVENRIRGGILLERSASKSSQLRREAQETSTSRRTASPRLNAALPIESSRHGKSRAKIATPIMGTFTEPMDADLPEVAGENGDALKGKRAARPRIKDHHGLQDSLSPKGLPTKRQHKKNGSYSISEALSMKRNASQRDEETPISEPSRKATGSRTNSRSVKNNGDREASSTPRIAANSDLVDEPESLPGTVTEDVSAVPLRPSARRMGSRNASTAKLDLKPPGSSRIPVTSPVLKDEAEELGSPGPEEENDESADVPDLVADVEVDGSEEEIDPNEARYCYCNGVSYGEMVACDNDDCAREWFHLECTGLRNLPPARSTWYCDECKANMVK